MRKVHDYYPVADRPSAVRIARVLVDFPAVPDRTLSSRIAQAAMVQTTR